VDGAPIEPIRSAIEDENALLSINYTSGTTGRPKGVMYSHRGAHLNALGQIASHRLGTDTTFLWTLPMFHCNGWCMPWAVTGAAGTHVCLRAIDPPEIFRLIDRHGVTHFNAAPTVLLMLAADPAASGRRFDPNIRVCTGGAPPSPTLLEQMEKLGIQITHLYGLTETYGPHVVCEMKDAWKELDATARAKVMSRQGVPFLFATHLRVVDDAMRDVPTDTTTMGEVVMRGNNVMLGYFDDADATAEAFRGGWFHSGDVGVVHPDTYIELRDRSKDIIISGGENISTIEVENTLYQHPDVLEVAVVGVPHDKWGEVPKAFVAVQPGTSPDAQALIEFARERLAHFKCPKSVEFGELPKTATGKIQKFKLREREWGGREKRIQG
jgi:fatty-acyl-CoA synthase